MTNIPITADSPLSELEPWVAEKLRIDFCSDVARGYSSTCLYHTHIVDALEVIEAMRKRGYDCIYMSTGNGSISCLFKPNGGHLPIATNADNELEAVLKAAAWALLQEESK